MQQIERPRGIVVEELLRIEHRLAGLDKSGEVQDGIEAAMLENRREQVRVAGVGLDEFSLCGNRPAMTLAEIVEHGYGMSGPSAGGRQPHFRYILHRQ